MRTRPGAVSRVDRLPVVAIISRAILILELAETIGIEYGVQKLILREP